MASIASHGGIGLPFNCDIFAQFNGIGKRKFLGCPIVISNGGHRRGVGVRSGGKWRIEAVGKKKRSRRSKAKEKSTEDKPRRQADVLEYYDQTVSSPRRPYNIPAVLRIPQLLPVERKVRQSISRQEILLRDCYICQYCSRFSRNNLTIDHVIPVSRGGQWSWENLVSACFKCNSKKGQQTLEEANMTLLSTPKAPEEIDIVAMPQKQKVIKMLMKKGVPDQWAQYVGKPKSTIDDLNLKELSIDGAS